PEPETALRALGDRYMDSAFVGVGDGGIAPLPVEADALSRGVGIVLGALRQPVVHVCASGGLGAGAVAAALAATGAVSGCPDAWPGSYHGRPACAAAGWLGAAGRRAGRGCACFLHAGSLVGAGHHAPA